MALVPEALRRLFTGGTFVPGGRPALFAPSDSPSSIPASAGRPLGAEEKGSRTGALVAFEQLGQPVWSPRDYGSFAREGFMQNAILYRSVRMIAEAAASIPLILYEGDAEIEAHPLLDLMRQPSYDHTGVDFLESWFGFLLVAGNAYVEAVQVGGVIRELHILRPDRMKVIPGPDGWPEGYEYTAGGQSIRFMDEVLPGVRPILHTRLFHPANDHYGMSPIEAAGTAIDIHNEASKWNKALLDNSARPSGALVYAASNGQMTAEQFERLKSELETSYQSARNAGRPMLLEGGLDWKPLSLSPKDMDFIEAKNSAAREIALALGVPPMLLGIPGDNTYAADWSEYFGHQPGDGSNDVYFHLDPLWASANIDCIGLDVYWPLADWREGRTHTDYLAGTRSTYDLNYLKSNVRGGEGFDWYYASQANRDNQVRSPINDSYGKPWVFRFKDIKSWWLNQHFNRPGGIEGATPTAWVPQSKPFWMMEIGCPAVDKGANQPNVFVDPKSAESALPYYSSGVRDDLIQRRFLKAFIHAFDWTKPGYVADANPVSGVTGARMVDLDHVHVYCWDARPFPAFPQETDIWGDGGNWAYGHWLNGRLASAPLAELAAVILQEYGFNDFDAAALNGIVPGYVIDRIMSARDALQPLELAYFFDSLESGGKIKLRHRGLEPPVKTVTVDGVVEARAGSDLVTLTRAQETDLPASAKLRFISGADDYRQAVAEARRLAGASGRVSQADLAIVLDDGLASGIVDTWLFESWAARERAQFALPPSALAIEPGDVLTFDQATRSRFLRVTEVSEHGTRDIKALAVDPDLYGRSSSPDRTPRTKPPVQTGAPLAAFLDLPLLKGTEEADDGYVAAVQQPWPGGVAVYSSAQSTGYALKNILSAPATLGRTLDPLSIGPEGRIDWAASLRVRLSFGSLTSADLVTVLSGENAAAIQNADGEWEVVQFLNATLVDVGTYRLTGLLRGQAGTETAMRAPVAANALFVLLNTAVQPVALGLDDLNLPFNWRYGPANRDIGDVSYQTVEHAFKGLGLRPYSPLRVTGTRNGAGDLAISWLRRTRVGGDSWDQTEVPLSEDVESYEIDVMQGAIPKRTISATTTAATYTAAEQTADFGSPQASVDVRVHQMSTLYGRGAPRAAVI